MSAVFQPTVEFFSGEVMIHPVTNRPEDKRSFIPSLIEKAKVGGGARPSGGAGPDPLTLEGSGGLGVCVCVSNSALCMCATRMCVRVCVRASV